MANSFDLMMLPWLLFMAYWAITARNLAQTKQREPWTALLSRSAILVIAGVLVFSNWLRIGFLARRFVPEMPGIRDAGIACALAGVFLAIWARRHIGQYWSGTVTLKVDHKLVQSGPYAYVRHPIYSGLFLALLGTVLALGEWRGVAALFLLLIAHWRKARNEEALLAQEFGDEFLRYRQHTGFLIPRFR